MFSFYKSSKPIHRKNYKSFSTNVVPFVLKDSNQSEGVIIKVSSEKSSESSVELKQQLHHFIEVNPGSLFILTTPTIKLNTVYGDIPNPGHNFAFITDLAGSIKTCVSKRPQTGEILAERKRAPDERFQEHYSPVVRIYNSRFTTYEEEIENWAARAVKVSDFPLYMHVIPLQPELGVNKEVFDKNVKQIIASDNFYSLHSTVHPNGDHFIPASNCNGAVYNSIFGNHDNLIQDMFCQEAVMKMMKPFVKNWSSYEKSAATLGLTKGIETSPIQEDNYRASFTC